jgi:cytochrome c
MEKVFLALISTVGLVLTTPAFAQPGDAAKGAQVFRQSCRVCHGVDPGISRSGGPNLSALAKDGPAGIDPDFDYSPPFKAAVDKGLVWSEKSLDAFLEAPGRVIPGTTMPVGAAVASERADLMAYLLSLKK